MQVLERQKAWQQRWRERHEREGTLYDAVAVVEDVIIGRSVTIPVSVQCCQRIDAVHLVRTLHHSIMGCFYKHDHLGVAGALGLATRPLRKEEQQRMLLGSSQRRKLL